MKIVLRANGHPVLGHPDRERVKEFGVGMRGRVLWPGSVSGFELDVQDEEKVQFYHLNGKRKYLGTFPGENVQRFNGEFDPGSE